MLRTTLVLLLAAGLLAGLASVGSALFTSTATVDSNTFTTGTVVLNTNPTATLVTFSNMAPGDQVTAPITVTNNGTLQLRYAVTSVATNADNKNLRSQLVLTVKSGVTDCSNNGFGNSGTQLYSGVLGSDSPGTNIIGNPAQGEQTGDRTLNASSSETLCFNVTLPLSTGNAYQNATTTATFTFYAEQTANNP
jgi:predicted ribosomally synthesized peptide with SipW-like signal peptide